MSEGQQIAIFSGYSILSICLGVEYSATIGWGTFAVCIILHALFIKGE